MCRDLYVFDMDYTLIDVDSSTMWCRYLVERGIVKEPDFLKREAELMAQYDSGTMDVRDYIAFMMRALRHLTAAEINKLCAQYVREVLSQHVFPQARALVRELQEQGEQILVLSASAAFIVRSAAALFKLAPEQVIAIEVDRDGEHYGTTIVGQPPYKSGKVLCLQAWQHSHGWEGARVHFWTDSQNDLPLCRYASCAQAVNPSPEFAAAAQELDMPILHWRVA